MKSVYDKNGIPVYPGDLIRTFHFTGPRRRKFFLYHVAVLKDGYLFGVPASTLGCKEEGGTFLLDSEWFTGEVIDGPIVKENGKEYILFTERPKRKDA